LAFREWINIMSARGSKPRVRWVGRGEYILHGPQPQEPHALEDTKRPKSASLALIELKIGQSSHFRLLRVYQGLQGVSQG